MLLKSRRFAPLFSTQFFGALNDNLFKSAFVASLTYGALAGSTGSFDADVNLATIALIAPFFLFSAFAGELADGVDKSRLAVVLKLSEALVMVVAAAGLIIANKTLLLVALFAMGTQSAFFGPIKYALLPQHIEATRLVEANAWVEGATFVAIVIGSALGTAVASLPGGELWVAGMLVVFALVGLMSAALIPAAPPRERARLRTLLSPVSSVRNMWRAGRRPGLLSTMLLASGFWLLGAVVLGQLPKTNLLLEGGPMGLVVLLTIFTIGIGAGSMAAERLSARLGALRDGALVHAALLMALSLFVLGGALGAGSFVGVALALALLGVGGGLFAVPLNARIQELADPAECARVIALNNVLNAGFMVLGAGAAAAALVAGVSLSWVFVAAGVVAFVVAMAAGHLHARSAAHLTIRLLVRFMYRIDVRGLAHVPMRGGALIAVNHQSFIDAFIVGALVQRRMHFVMDHRMANLPVLRHFFRFAGAIPIASRDEDASLLERAYERIDAALAAGDLVCIFPEGHCTRDGHMGDFRPGILKILAARQVPVVPVGLRGLWGSFFSYAHGYPMRSLPRRVRARVCLRFGEPMEVLSNVHALRTSVGSLADPHLIGVPA